MAWKTSVMVVANVTADSDELLEALIRRADSGAVEFTLLAPATGGGPEGRAAARQKLEAALNRMREAGLEVQGSVGDADPIVAVQEAWDPRRFDEVVVSTLPTNVSRWLRVDLPHRLERITGHSVRHIVAADPRPAPQAGPPPRHPEHHGILEALAALPGGKWPPRSEASPPPEPPDPAAR
jgi:GABA permease